MYLVPHVLTGVAIAANIQPPLLAVPLAFLSHFVLDAIPHWTVSVKKINNETYGSRAYEYGMFIVDLIIAIAIGLYFSLVRGIFTPDFWLFFSCALAAAMPDAVRFPYYFLHYRPKIAEWWEKIHLKIDQDVNHSKLFHGNVVVGIITQILVSAACLWLLR